jgi:hypothetical protein
MAQGGGGGGFNGGRGGPPPGMPPQFMQGGPGQGGPGFHPGGMGGPPPQHPHGVSAVLTPRPGPFYEGTRAWVDALSCARRDDVRRKETT